jgi:pilus assembly protein CpaE
MTEVLPIGPAAGALLPFIGFATDAPSRKIMGMAAAAAGWAAPDIREGGLEAAHAHMAACAEPAVLLVDLSGTDAPLGAVDALADLCPADSRMIAIGTRNDIHLYRGLKAMGVSDYLLKPLDPDALLEAIAALRSEASALAPASGRARERGRLMAFIGARGGVGTSTLAVAAASLLAREGEQRVTLVDLDLQTGTLGLDLDAEPSTALANILESPERLDEILVASTARAHPLGFRLLAAEEPLQKSLVVRPESVQALVAHMLAQEDLVLVDLPRRLDQAVRSVLRIADRVVIVATPSLAGLRDMRRLADHVAGLRAGQRALLVANRVGGAADVPIADFEVGLGARLDCLVADAPALAARAAGAATSLAAIAGKRAPGPDLARLAGLLEQSPERAEAAPSARGLLARLRSLAMPK